MVRRINPHDSVAELETLLQKAPTRAFGTKEHFWIRGLIHGKKIAEGQYK
jgi:hypothetical protein